MEAGINDRVRERATHFLEPELINAVSHVYGCLPVSLGLRTTTNDICGYRVRRLYSDRFVFAPFNFQPVLADLNEKIVEALVDHAQRAGPKSSAHVRLHHKLDPVLVRRLGLKCVTTSVETLLALSSKSGTASVDLPKKQRWKLKKAKSDAEQARVRVRTFDDRDTLGEFYDVLARAYRAKHRMIPQPFCLMWDILRHSNGSRNSLGYVAEHDSGRVLGGILVLRDETQWSYGWAANVPSPEVEHLGLGTLLVGTAIADAARSGVPVFSFGSSPLTHEGLRAFKRGWGAEEHEVYDYHWRETPRPIDLHQGFRLAKRVVSIAPIPLLKALSPFMVRWLV